MPSILRNSRYRRDQRQLDEQEDMWFNEDDDSDEVIPFSSDIITKKMDTELDSIGMKYFGCFLIFITNS